MKLPAIYKGGYSGNKTWGFLVSKLIPGDSLLLSKLGKWYAANSHHAYNLGDILILNSRNRAGHGIRPVVIVEDYQMRESRSNPYGVEGMYIVTTSADVFGDFLIWMRENKIPRCVERATNKSLVYKWNIEYRFRRTNCRDIEEALRLYKSEEVDPELMGFTAEQISAPLGPGEISLSSGYPPPGFS